MNDAVLTILSSGVAVTIIEGMREALKWRRERKAQKEDRAESKAEAEKSKKTLNTEKRLKLIEDKTDAQSEALKYILFDRIRYLGQAYISEKEIDFDDRRILNNMHSVYHNGLCGNGDLDSLMQEVNQLPLKIKK